MHPPASSWPPRNGRPRLLDPAELGRRLLVREWVIDVRPRRAFAAGHVPGTVNIELAEGFATSVSRFYDWGAPLTLVAETHEQHAEARRRLLRVGIHRFTGAAIGRPEALMESGDPASFPVTGFVQLARALADGRPIVLDVRQREQRADGFVRGSLHIPVQTLSLRSAFAAGTQVWLYSQSGHSASIAASLVARAGCRPVLVDARYDDPARGAAAVGLHISPSEEAGRRPGAVDV